MIIAYLTEDYLDWAEIFLESLNLVHPEIKVHLDTRNLNNKQEKKLEKLHKNLVINNKIWSIKDFSEQHNIPIKEVEESKKGCNEGPKKHNHRLWMNLTADGDRINNYLYTILAYENEKVYMLADIDILFRKRMDYIFEEAEKHDVGLKLRSKRKNGIPNKLNTSGKNRDALINIGTLTITNSEKGLKFMRTWVDYINSVPIKKRSRLKWGQYAIACAFNDCMKDTDIFRFQRGSFSPYLLENSPVWFFKSKKKEESFKKAKEELNALRKR